VAHPEASRWGFQITARLASDPSKQAGTFTANDVVRVLCDATPAHDAPCNGALEFPEHSNAPRTAAGAGFTFSVDWTPPATDVGDIVFYAAGNAANGDGTNSNDRIYTTSSVISPGCANTQKPVITSVVNGGSFGTALTANSMVTIFGQNFASAATKRAAGAADITNGFPTKLACIAVEIDGKRAPISYVQSNQINVQAPTTTSLGAVSVRVIANADEAASLPSDPSSVQLLSAAPAFFTFDGKAIAALFATSNEIVGDASVVASAKPAKPGDLVALYGTGFGPTNPAVAAGAITPGQATITGQPTITIGGTTVTPADILYIGLSPGSISGLYQINLRIPATVPDGNAAVVVRMNSISSQDGATLAIKR
jgi:uncharacterized protein (TIGR03437 family)